MWRRYPMKKKFFCDMKAKFFARALSIFWDIPYKISRHISTCEKYDQFCMEKIFVTALETGYLAYSVKLKR